MNPLEEVLRSASTIASNAVRSGVDIGRREGVARERLLLGQIEGLERMVAQLAEAVEGSLPQTAETARMLLQHLKNERA